MAAAVRANIDSGAKMASFEKLLEKFQLTSHHSLITFLGSSLFKKYQKMHGTGINL